MITGLFGIGISSLLYGPIQVLPDSVVTLGMGLFFAGIFSALAMVPCIPETIRVNEHLYNEEKLQDLACGLFTAFFALGEMLGPILGNFLFIQVGFRTTADIIAGICLVTATIYLIFCRESR